VIERIEVSGNRKNSRDSILRYLQLKPGMALTSDLAPNISDRLWQAARFLTNYASVGLPDQQGRVALKIELVEYGPAPSLDQEFTRQEKAQLRMRQWWAKLDQIKEDLVFNFKGPAEFPYASELCLSPGVG